MIDSAWIAARQNPDGGWSYRNSGGSSTEPTVYALLALAGGGDPLPPPTGRASAWLARWQRPDGGWPPRPGVDESTWVTALVALLPASMLGGSARAKAVSWLLRQVSRPVSVRERVKNFLLSGRVPATAADDGWPWYPGTAAWVTPTALSVLALERELAHRPSPEIEDRCARGRAFLMARRCEDGGWNHGASRALGYEASSYPETTGMALLALRRVEKTLLSPSFACAERHLAATRSLEAACWLHLGLLAHGRFAGPLPKPDSGRRQIQEGTLWMIATAARAGRPGLL